MNIPWEHTLRRDIIKHGGATVMLDTEPAIIDVDACLVRGQGGLPRSRQSAHSRRSTFPHRESTLNATKAPGVGPRHSLGDTTFLIEGLMIAA